MRNTAQIKLGRLGLPVQAKDWTEADWKDLHEAIEQAIAKISKRHADGLALSRRVAAKVASRGGTP